MLDEMIVELYWNRNESAIIKTEEKYGRYLTKIAYNILNDWHDSLESVNDTYYYFMDSIFDISYYHGMSESKVKSMLHRTRIALRRHLEKEGFFI